MGLVLAVVVGGGGLAMAATADKALSDADGRRQAAENGVRSIKGKSPAHIEEVRTSYMDAASRNNAWVETLCDAVKQGTAPDVGTIEPAATSLVAWVSVRNRALGVKELTKPIAAGVKTQVVQGLTEVTEVARSNRGAPENKRMKAAADLKARLQCRTWEEIQ